MKLLRMTGWAMIWAGALILAFLVYQLFGTAIGTNLAQSAAGDQIDVIFEESLDALIESGVPVPVEAGGPVVDPVNVDMPTLFPEPIPEGGEPFARLIIPAADIEKIVWEGVERDDLKNGPGHMPWTALPGQPGNSVISGHRTTYGAPFLNLDDLVEGDVITVETATGSHVYEVRQMLIVAPTAVEVTEPRIGAWLTLTTCHPISSSSKRLVIHAELVDGPNYPFSQTLLADLEDAS